MARHTHADTTLACSGCGQAFIFTAGEQELQQLRGIRRAPEYCRTCARHRRGSGKGLPPAAGPGRRARR